MNIYLWRPLTGFDAKIQKVGIEFFKKFHILLDHKIKW